MTRRWSRVAALTTAQVVSIVLTLCALFYVWAAAIVLWDGEWLAGAIALTTAAFVAWVAWDVRRIRRDA